MLRTENLTLLIDERDAYELAKFLEALPSNRPRPNDVFEVQEQDNEDFRAVLNTTRNYVEEKFSNLRAGDTFRPWNLLGMSNTGVMHEEGRTLLRDFEGVITMRYTRFNVTHLVFPNGDIMSSEALIVTNWDGFGR